MQILKPEKYDKKQDMENSYLALCLDSYQCQWHWFVEGVIKQGSFPHHLWGRRRRWDVNSQITLCAECHDKVHRAIQKDGQTEINLIKLTVLMDSCVIPARRGKVEQLGL